ncbi:hypothetical protein N9L68_02785 [bacterium]|nr:hypothetical protein [bacterium]
MGAATEAPSDAGAAEAFGIPSEEDCVPWLRACRPLKLWEELHPQAEGLHPWGGRYLKGRWGCHDLS